MHKPKQKLSLLVNMVAPARLALFRGLAEHFELQIVHGGTESNRDFWQEVESALHNATIRRAWGWQLPIISKKNGRTVDRRYIHIVPGYFSRLVRFHPHAIITGEMGFRTLIALAYGTVARKPVWIWWGGTLQTERKRGISRTILRAAISRWARHWISYGQTSTEYLESIGVKRDLILQIQNSVDEHVFAADIRPRFKIQPRPVLLYVGQFILRKGIELFLNEAAALKKEGLEFSVVLVGNGPDKRALEQLSTSLALKSVVFLPAQKPLDMPSVYRSADILVFPTLEDVWGLVANEAMLSGLQVLCSKNAGCAPELFSSSHIFDPEDPEEFKYKLRQAITGQLAKPDCSRLKSTAQILADIIRAIESSLAPVAPATGISQERACGQ